MATGERILLKLREPSPPEVPGDPAALAGAAADSWNSLAAPFGLPGIKPLLAAMDDPDLIQAVVDDIRTENPGLEAEIPNPLLCFAVDVPADLPLTGEQLVDALEQIPEIEWAQLDDEVVWAAVNRLNNPAGVLQTYLNPATVGIGAEAAWALPGGDGQPVMIGIVEPYDFDRQHRDVPSGSGAIDMLTPPPSDLVVDDLSHATAVLGIIAAVDNTDDCVGVAPKSFIHFGSSVAPGGRMSESELFLLMHRVGFRLGPGDVLNVSVAHRERASGDEYPIDFRPATRTAAQLLSFRGTIVVEAAGNGIGHPPNSSCMRGFDIGLPAPAGIRPANSPAIVVGGIQPLSPLGPFARDRCSNFGARVDCCAWADSVLTLTATTNILGIPHTIAPTGGTSMSAAIITGVVAAMQGITKAKGKPPLSAANIKSLFKDPALTSDSAPGQGVGRMPNLGAIVPRL